MTMRNTSNIFYGAHLLMQRPPGIPVFGTTGWVLLSQFMAERMRTARQGLSDAERPSLARVRLLAFWADVSASAIGLHLEADVVAALSQLNDTEYLAAGYWLDARWHHDALSMASLLWWLQAGQNVVSAAHDLHQRASRGRATTDDRGDSIRSGITLAILVGLA